MSCFLLFRFILTSFLLSVLLFFSSPVRATERYQGIKINPAFQEITLTENDTEKHFSVSLTNATDQATILRLAVYDFGSLDESGGVAFLGATNDLSKKYTLASWMHPEKDVVTLDPGETANIGVTIDNHDNLGPGGHYGAITFKTEDPDGIQSGDPVSVNQLFSTLVFVKKVGKEVYRLNLSGIEYSSNPFRFQDVLKAHFENQGNVHVVPRGTVLVTDPLGRIVWKGIINEESALILPETTRIYGVRFKPQSWSFFPGRYTVSVDYRYDGTDVFTTTKLHFIFIPFSAILFVLILLATGGWYVARRRKQTGEKVASDSHSIGKPDNA